MHPRSATCCCFLTCGRSCKTRGPDAPVAAPIGVFDSGVGGLTVLRALTQVLPPRSRAPHRPGRISWLATDDAQRFARVGGRFFGTSLNADAVQIVDL